MDETLRLALVEAGVNVDTAMERFMNNTALLERFLRKFYTDQNYPKLKEALGNNDTQEAFSAAHTLKGVSGNLSLDTMYEVVSEITELLRAEDIEGAKEFFPRVTEIYERTLEGLQKCYPID
jgi:HPt (histidine-containing phosphotransfer) domain-containing protein